MWYLPSARAVGSLVICYKKIHTENVLKSPPFKIPFLLPALVVLVMQ